MSWNANEEKLLSLIVLDDGFARQLSDRAGPAFFRAFIVENRATGAISMKHRFKDIDGDRQWYSVTPKEQGPGTVDELRQGMRTVLEEAAHMIQVPLPPGAIQCFDPPDDRGDWERTIEWLIERDLVEVTGAVGGSHADPS